MQEYNPIPSSLRDCLVNTLADIAMLPEFKRMSKDKVVELQRFFGLSSLDTSDLVYEAKERVRHRKYWLERLRENPRRDPDAIDARHRDEVAKLKAKYDTFMFWCVFIAAIVLCMLAAALFR